MADILIFGMKMPTDEPLRLVLNPNGQLFVDHGVTFTEYEAIELPEHGDLIDRDAFREENEYYLHREFINPKYEDTLDDLLKDAPIIVPSNKEEKELDEDA